MSRLPPRLDSDKVWFPPAERALERPNGLLAVGGALTPEWLVHAYRRGIFPWFDPGQPILWWTPDPRMVLFPGEMRISRSLARLIRRAPYRVTMDRRFAEVVDGCAAGRPEGTWITPAMRAVYVRLHAMGIAHSVEVSEGGTLAGGLYGVAIGRAFFGESMFSAKPNASKLALAALVRRLADWGFGLIDCQVSSAHLRSLGAREIPRARFCELLERFAAMPPVEGPWRPDPRPEAGDGP